MKGFRCVNLGLLLLGLQFAAAKAELTALYPLHESVCHSDGHLFKGERYTEKEIRNGCAGYKFAEITEDCGIIRCCNSLNMSGHEVVPVERTSPELAKICSTSPSSKVLYGMFQDFKSQSISTLFVLSEYLHSIYETHDFIGCINKDLIEYFDEPGYDDPYLTVVYTYANDSKYERKVLNPNTFKYRLWDLANDCFNLYYNDLPFPIGADETSKPYGRAVYCKRGFDCQSFIQPSNPNFDFSMPVDVTLRQDKCINEIEVDLESSELYEELGGSFECFEECKSKTTLSWALISEDNCTCTSTDSFPSLMDSYECNLQCPDNATFICGGNAGGSGSSKHVSVYNTDPSYAANANAGFKYWNCMFNRLYNPISEVLHSSMWSNHSVDTASKCLTTCKEQNLGIAMFMMLYDGGFTCTCMLHDAYKFRMQDVTYYCLKPYTHWCPDLDGPCTKEKTVDDDESHVVVYCLDDSYCGPNLIMPNDEVDICKIGQIKLDWSAPIDKCSESFYSCSKNVETGRAVWLKKECPKGQVYSPDFQRCTSFCNDIPSEICSQSNATTCNCVDDVGILWSCQLNDQCSLPCSLYQEGFTGNQSWTCGPNGQFTTPAPNRKACLEEWIPDLNDALSNSNISSNEITQGLEDELDNLEEDISAGGLVNLASLMEKLLAKRSDELGSGTASEANDFFLSFLTNVDRLISFEDTWSSLEQNEGYATNELLVNNIVSSAKLHLNTTAENGTFTFETGATIETQTFYMSRNEEIVYQTDIATISIPKGQSLPSTAVGTVYNFKNMTKRFPKELQGYNGERDSLELLTTTMDFTLFSNLSLNETERVKIEFKASKSISISKADEIFCVFWDPNNKTWSQAGCAFLSFVNSIVTCECDHLTNFGLLFGGSSKGDDKNEMKSKLSKILGGISIACLVFTQLFKHFVDGNKSNPFRRTIELNRNYSLIVGLAVFIFISELEPLREPDMEIFCTMVTFLLHYVWLTVFAWTLLEGFQLYRLLIRIFDSGDHRQLPFYLCGYGGPGAIVIITVITAVIIERDNQEGHYHSTEICWLNEDYVWAFTGPAILVMLFNIAIFARAFSVTIRNRPSTNRKILSNYESIKNWLRTCLILSFLLGFTWIFGIIAGMPGLGRTTSDAFQMLSIVFNCSSGFFIFLQSVVFNQKLRAASKKLMRTSTFATKST